MVLADTHVRTVVREGRRIGRPLPASVRAALPGATAILHAGDVLDGGVLRLLGEHAPVYAVLGNNDLSLVGQLPITLELELAGVRIGMIHDSGPSAGRAGRLRRRFPHANVVVFGHSHVPVATTGEGGQLLFNPGSPTQRRTQPACSFGELRLADGMVIEHRIIELEAQS